MAIGRKIFLGSTATVVLILCAAKQAASQDYLDPKRGLGDTGASNLDLQAINANWYYDWGPTPSTGVTSYDAMFYPDFWSGGEVTTSNINSAINSAINNTAIYDKLYGVTTAATTYIMTFNEPEVSTQSNMTVSQAITSYTSLVSGLNTAINNLSAANKAKVNIKIVAPAVSDDSTGHSWLSSFMSTAKTNGLEVDAVAFHWYDDSTPTSTGASDLENSINYYYGQYSLPLLIGEFAIHDWGGNYTDQQIIDANETMINTAIPNMDSDSRIAGFAWYPWFSDAGLFSGSTDTPTRMGYNYVGAIGNNNGNGVASVDISGQNIGEHVLDLTNGTVTVSTSATTTVKYIDAVFGYNNVGGTVNWALASPAGTPNNWVQIQSGATLNKTGTNQVTFSGGSVSNGGTLQVMQGTLVLGDSMTGSGSANVRSGAALSLTSTGSMSTAPLIDVRSGGTLNISALSNGLNLQSGQNLNVDGNTIGNVTALPGSLVSGGGVFSNNLTTSTNSTIQVGKGGAGVPSRILIDNFNSYSTGNLNAMSTPWTAHEDTSFDSIVSFNGSNALTYGWGDNTDTRGASRPLPAGTVLDNNSTATYFFQIAATNNNPNHSIGLGTQASTGTENFGDYETQLRLKAGTGSTFAIDARSGAAFSNTLASGLALNTYYNIWMVVNQPTDTYDIYMNTGTGAATAANKLDSTPLAFRNGTTNDLTELIALAGTSTVSDGALIDNVYYQSGVDLSNPLLNFNPGLTWSPATMSVNGNYTQNGGSTLALNLQSPTSYDALHVSGHANLGGTLNVTFAIGASTPHIGDTYQLITAGAMTGSFSTVQMPALSGGLAWDASKLSTTGAVSIFDGTPGDFTQTGHVDMADLSAMLLALSNRSAYESQYGMDDFELNTVGDINHDGVFSNADIQAFLNLLASGGGSAAPVPEPESFLLLGWGGFALLWISRRKLARPKQPALLWSGSLPRKFTAAS